MNHQNGRKKLNMKPAHRKSVIRNQAIHLINFGILQTTKVRAKEVQRFVERLVTVAREGVNFNTIRRLKATIPYDNSAVKKLLEEIAPKYVTRHGGYTRVIPLGMRPSDTATIARLEWV